jgi:hypothetical protein
MAWPIPIIEPVGICLSFGENSSTHGAPNKTQTMKIQSLILASAIICLGLAPAYSQFGPRAQTGPQLGGSTARLFGENTAYSATLEMQSTDSSTGDTITTPGKIAALEGKSRFEMDVAQIKGGHLSPQGAEQMKQMGMDEMVMISRPDKKIAYMVYPNLEAYADMAMQNPEAAAPATNFKLETTELGKETLDGHPCVKKKAVVTDDKGNKHESIVWNATDLKNFPIKIETAEQGHKATMLFKDVKLAKPDAGLFDPPTGYKHYDNLQQMMQQEMMKRMGMPPH